MAESCEPRLFFDPNCGPCTLFARLAEWASRSSVRALPYDGEEACRALGDLPDAERFAYAHFVDSDGRRSGSAIMGPLLERTIGPVGGRIVDQVPPVDHGLHWLYDRFWNYRRTRGCAAGTSGPAA
jgi:hypothetical protein